MKNNHYLKSTLTACTSALLLSLSVSAGAQTTQAAQPMQHGAHSKDMKQGAQGMQQKMSNMPMTGDADHDFAMMMKSHHQAGIDMAEQELKNGKDAQLKSMAKKIVTDQTKEIDKLDKWMSSHKATK